MTTPKHVGTEVATFRFPDADRAGVAFETLFETTEGISCWRFCSTDRKTWLVTIMGESHHADYVREAEATARTLGGEPYDDLPAEMLQALRLRRWETALRTMAAGQKERVERTHYGRRGAYLYPDGRMMPGPEPD
jgi:hypothetical protein